MTEKHFDRKAYSREEINIIVAEQLQLCVEPICKEIGKAIEGLNIRLKDVEIASNAMIEEMRKWKESNYKTIQ